MIEGFVRIFRDFAQNLKDFAQIFRDFVYVFNKSKLLGVRLHPLYPRLVHHWVKYRRYHNLDIVFADKW